MDIREWSQILTGLRGELEVYRQTHAVELRPQKGTIDYRWVGDAAAAIPTPGEWLVPHGMVRAGRNVVLTGTLSLQLIRSSLTKP